MWIRKRRVEDDAEKKPRQKLHLNIAGCSSILFLLGSFKYKDTQTLSTRRSTGEYQLDTEIYLAQTRAFYYFSAFLFQIHSSSFTLSSSAVPHRIYATNAKLPYIVVMFILTVQFSINEWNWWRMNTTRQCLCVDIVDLFEINININWERMYHGTHSRTVSRTKSTKQLDENSIELRYEIGSVDV